MTKVTLKKSSGSENHLGASELIPLSAPHIPSNLCIYYFQANIIEPLILPRQSFLGRHYIQLLKVTIACKLQKPGFQPPIYKHFVIRWAMSHFKH